METFISLDLGFRKSLYTEEAVNSFLESEKKHIEGVYGSPFEGKDWYNIDVTYIFDDHDLFRSIGQLEKRVLKAFPKAKYQYDDGCLCFY